MKNWEGNSMVDWKKIGEVCITVSPPKKLEKELYSNDGLYPIIDQGQKDIVGYTFDESAVLQNGEYILFGDHTRYVKYYKGIFAQGADGLKILRATKEVLPRFFYFAFANTEVPSRGYSRHWSIAKELLIPIPPLSEQLRIVGILDTFTASIDNLKEQIAQRRKQYEYYRDQLLDLEGKPGVEMKMLGDLCLVKTGTKPVEIKDSGSYKYINAGTSESGFVDMFNCKADVVTTPSRGHGGIGFVGYQNEDFWLGPLCYQIRSFMDDCLKSKFLYYFLQSHNEEILKYKSEGGTPAVNANDIKKINIPVPSFQEQSRIVGILDTFEASIQNLEAQLKEREKQYEYYRNKLLTFE